MTVLKDAAEVARALVAPRPPVLQHPRVAVAHEPRAGSAGRRRCARSLLAYEDPDYTVDLRGWRPAPATTDGPALPGCHGSDAGPAQPARPPRRRSLMPAASESSSTPNASVPHCSGSPRAARSRARRTVAGAGADVPATDPRNARPRRRLGNGGLAAGQAASCSRVHRLKPGRVRGPAPLRQLEQLFARVDQRIGQIVEHGALRTPLLPPGSFPARGRPAPPAWSSQSAAAVRAHHMARRTRPDRHRPCGSPSGTYQAESAHGRRCKPSRLRSRHRPPTGRPGAARALSVCEGEPHTRSVPATSTTRFFDRRGAKLSRISAVTGFTASSGSM